MKKLGIFCLCFLMLMGCQSNDSHKTSDKQFYEDTYAILEKAGITLGLGTSSGKVVFYGTTESGNFQWMCELDDNLNTVSIMGFPSAKYVYGDEAVDDEEYAAFLKKTTLTQENLNEFSKAFYEYNIEKAKAGVSQ
ncbi:MAG: hypothetical protein RR585_15210 [Coprobacillus sp.]